MKRVLSNHWIVCVVLAAFLLPKARDRAAPLEEARPARSLAALPPGSPSSRIELSLSQPVLGDVFRAPVNLSIEAAVNGSNASSVEKVEFFQNDIKLGERFAPPYLWIWSNVPAGEHRLWVTATGAQGAFQRSETIRIRVHEGLNIPSDFNADRSSDLVWQHEDGSLAFWFMNRLEIARGFPRHRLAPGWKVRGIGDFDRDGGADLVLQHPDGSVAFWMMEGIAIRRGFVPYQIPPGWQIAGVADFNGDQQEDLVLTNADLSVAFWMMEGTEIMEGESPYRLPPNWRIAGTGDFNLDGQSDLVLAHATGFVAFWLLHRTQVVHGDVPFQTPPGWRLSGTGDFDGDGHTDLVLQNSTGTVAVWRMQKSRVKEGAILGELGSNNWFLGGPR